MHVFGSNELIEDVLSRDLCIGCGACVELCPYFKNHKGKTAMLFPCTLSQGRCFAFCPKAEVDLDVLANRFWNAPYEGTPLGKYREVLMARAGERMETAAFQAGGDGFGLDDPGFEKQANRCGRAHRPRGHDRRTTPDYQC